MESAAWAGRGHGGVGRGCHQPSVPGSAAPAPPAPEHPWNTKLTREELSLQLIQEPNLTAPSTPEPHLPWHDTDAGEGSP